jgi:hypothetical protein
MNWKQISCLHKQTSPPDEMGDAICADCGARVRIVLTEAAFMDTIDTIWRDHGRFGRHSKRCVRLENGDCLCSDDCSIGSR